MYYNSFSPATKLVDLILTNYKLLPILNRFGITLGFGDKTIQEICDQRRISIDLFITICNIYTFEDYLPSESTIRDIDSVELVDFLQNTHNYFLHDSLQEIENRLKSICEGCEEDHINMLHQFFYDYKTEVINHFNYEEEIVFPYMKDIGKKTFRPDYSIKLFEESHTNIEDKLSDLKSIIIKYLPQCCSSEKRGLLLEKLFCFQEELIIHSRIEEKILIPLASQIEREYAKK